MLDKLGGVFAPRPSTGPHKLRESLPLVIFLRNRLKYALTNCEVTKIVMQRLIKVDGKVRTDPNYPAGFMGRMWGTAFFFGNVQCNHIVSDVISIEKTGEYFRLIYDVKGRFTVHRITAEEAKVSRNILNLLTLTLWSQKWKLLLKYVRFCHLFYRFLFLFCCFWSKSKVLLVFAEAICQTTPFGSPLLMNTFI